MTDNRFRECYVAYSSRDKNLMTEIIDELHYAMEQEKASAKSIWAKKMNRCISLMERIKDGRKKVYFEAWEND